MDPSQPSQKEKVTAQKLRAQGSAFAAAKYRASWPIATKKVALSLVDVPRKKLRDLEETLQDLLRISGAEYAREEGDPGGLAWATHVHLTVALRLLQEMSLPRIAGAVGKFDGVAVETLRLAFRMGLRSATDRMVRRLYANEIDQHLLADVRVEMYARGLQPKTHPNYGRTLKRCLARASSGGSDDA